MSEIMIQVSSTPDLISDRGVTMLVVPWGDHG